MDAFDDRAHAKRLLIVRALMLGAFAMLLSYAHARGQAVHPFAWWSMLAWAIAAMLLWLHPRMGRPWWIVQSLADVFALSVLLYLTGGYSNPLVSLYMLPVLSAALTLPSRAAWLIGGLVVLVYSWLLRWYVPMPLFGGGAMHNEGFHLHLLGMWLTFAFSVSIIIGVFARMSEQRRHHERQLAEMRERALQSRSLVALAAQAAADAHELGTPINTLLLQWEEIRLQNDQEQRALAESMRRQLLHCKEILQRLSRRAQALSREGGDTLALDIALHQAMERWRNLHPNIRLTITGRSPPPAPMVEGPMLEQMLFILWDNAREAGAGDIRTTMAWNEREVHLLVEDDGQGFAGVSLDDLGHHPIPSDEGMGMGLYLVGFMLRQQGGWLRCSHAPGGGARIEFAWPLPRVEKEKA